jgi:4,5-DOPA dioxygenase extradiol
MGAVMDDLVPAMFIGHGSPMNTLERNRWTDAWAQLGAEFGTSFPRPRAILAVSAHWFVQATAVTAMANPRTIHDFFGFPEELFAFRYPAPGSPELAQAVVDTVRPTWVGVDHDSWGLDHGTWSVLAHLFPEADIPVVQLSIHALEPAEYHVELGRRLAPLREQGVLVVGSGNVVHHLGRLDWGLAEDGFDWAERFDADARDLFTTEPGAAAALAERPDFADVAPSPDHFLPVLYVAGLADAAGRPLEVIVEGCAYGSLSMTSYLLR